MKAEGNKDESRAPFVNCAALEELALNHLSLTVSRERVHEKGHLEVAFDVRTELQPGEETFFLASSNTSIEGKTLDGEQIFDLEIEYVLAYRCNEVHDWPKAELEHFANRNVIIHVWPYLRECVDQMSRRANLNRVLLPLLPPDVVTAKHKHPIDE